MTTFEVPTHHKAIVYDKPGEICTKVETIETPKPGVGEVLINLTHSGVCHSDQAVMTNRWKMLPAPTQPGQVGGHEGVGKVVAFGPGTENSGLKLGDRVGIKWLSGVCNNCIACLSGRDACCSTAKISGYYTPGTFQQYALGPANYVTPIPDEVPSDLAAPLLCGGLTVYSGLKKCGAKPGDTIVIPGAGGGLGHLAIQIGGKGMGFRMIGIDGGDKEDFVRGLGAEAFFDINKYSRDAEGTAKLTEDVKKASSDGLGAAGVVVCTASQTLHMLKLWDSCGSAVRCDPASMLLQEKRIVGSAVGNRLEAMETLNMAARGVIKTHFTVEPMSKLTEVFERMEKNQLQGRVVIDLSKE